MGSAASSGGQWAGAMAKVMVASWEDRSAAATAPGLAAASVRGSAAALARMLAAAKGQARAYGVKRQKLEQKAQWNLRVG